MNFVQAKGSLESAKDHPELWERMGSVSAPAWWPSFTAVEQRELKRIADVQNRKLADDGRASLNQWEAKVRNGLSNLGHMELFR